MTNFRKNIRLNKKIAEVGSFDELIDFIKNNQSFFFENALKYRKSLGYKEVDISSLYLNNVYMKAGYGKQANIQPNWSDKVSNTHSSPMGKLSNWGCDTDKPLGYPGWVGNIHYDFNEKTEIGSDIFKDTIINTGTGGSNDGKSFGYDFKLFAHDFKKMAYLELLKDAEKFKNASFERIQHVLEISYDLIDFTSVEFEKFVDMSKNNPELHAFLSSILMKGVSEKSDKEINIDKRKVFKIL